MDLKKNSVCYSMVFNFNSNNISVLHNKEFFGILWKFRKIFTRTNENKMLKISEFKRIAAD